MAVRITGAGLSSQGIPAEFHDSGLVQQLEALQGLDVVDGAAAAGFVDWAQGQPEQDSARAFLQAELDGGLRCGAEALQVFGAFGLDLSEARPAVPVLDATAAGLLNEAVPLDSSGGLTARPGQAPGAGMLDFLSMLNAQQQYPVFPGELDFSDGSLAIPEAEQAQLDALYGPGAADYAGRLVEHIVRFRAAMVAAMLGAAPEELFGLLALDPADPEDQAMVQSLLGLTRALQGGDLEGLQPALGDAEDRVAGRARQGAPNTSARTAQRVLRERYGIPAGGGSAVRNRGPGLANDELNRAGRTAPPENYPADLVQMCNEANKSVKRGANRLRPDMPPDLIRAGYRAHQLGLRITSTDEGRPGDGVHTRSSNHYTGHAIDVAGPPSAMAQFTREQQGKRPRELFYDPVGGWKRGRAIGAIGGHRDHVHIAF